MKIGLLTLLPIILVFHFSQAQGTSKAAVTDLYQEMAGFEEAEKLLLITEKQIKNTLGTKHLDYIKNLNALAILYLKNNQLQQAFAHAITGIALNSDGFDNYFPNSFNPSFTGERYSPSQYNGKIESAQLKELFNLNYYDNNKQQESIKILLAVTKAQYLDAKKKNDPQQKGLLYGHYNIAKAAMRLKENYRNDFVENKYKLAQLKENNDFVEYGIKAALDLEDPVCITESFAFAEQNKSILLLDAIKGEGFNSIGDLSSLLISKELELQRKKSSIEKDFLESKTEIERKTFIAEQEELGIQIDDFLQNIKKNHLKYYNLNYNNKTASAEDIKKVLDENTLFLQYFVTDDNLYLFAITKQKVELFSLDIPKEILNNKIEAFHQSLSRFSQISANKEANYNSYTQNASWFYNNLMAKVLEGKKASNLIIVTDGLLSYLPFETFLVNSPKEGEQDYKKLHYLLRDYKISYNYSASLFLESQAISKEKRTFKKGIFGAAASYYPFDSTLATLRTSSQVGLRHNLQVLSNTGEELSLLAANFKGDFLQDKAANEAFFKTNILDYNVLHLAMQGIVNLEEPMSSSLVFTENRDSIEDNFLYAYEIARLNLEVDLVVLSAAELNYEYTAQVEGIRSVARSFMYAGAPSLLMSLWQVDAPSTAQIMNSFYQYLSEGKSKDAALQQAKLDYLEQATDITAHPAFWSPFVQVANNQPIEIRKVSGIGLKVLYILIGLILGLIVRKLLSKKKSLNKTT